MGNFIVFKWQRCPTPARAGTNQGIDVPTVVSQVMRVHRAAVLTHHTIFCYLKS